MNKKVLMLVVTLLISVCFYMIPDFASATNDFSPITNSGDETVYIKDYEEYENLMQEFDQNEVNKRQYIKQLVEELEALEASSKINLYQAKVISISEPEMQYTQDQTTAKFSAGLYQNGEVEIINNDELEGIKLTYMNCLTYDVYGNITMPEVKVGDIVNISLMQIDEENVIAFSPEPDTYVKRFPTMIIVTIVILFIVLAYIGKHFTKLLIPLFLMIDILFGVMGPLVLEGFNLWLLTFFVILMTSIAICVLKLGTNFKAVTAVLSTVIVSLTLIPVHLAIDYLLNFSGLTTESFLMSSGVTPNVINSEVYQIFNFHSLSISISVIMSFVLSTLVACKIVEKNDTKFEDGEAISEDIKDYIADMSFVATITIITTILPKYMLLMVKSYTVDYIVQSEMLLIEFVRVLIVLLAMILTIPVTKMIYKFLED